MDFRLKLFYKRFKAPIIISLYLITKIHGLDAHIDYYPFTDNGHDTSDFVGCLEKCICEL